MRFATVSTLGLCTGMAFASPMVKKALVEDIVTDVVYVTVTEIFPPAPATTQVVVEVPTPVAAVVVSTSTYVVPPPSSSVILAASSADPVAASSATTVPGTSAADDSALPVPSDYKSYVLYHHNIHRLNHTGSGKLVYDDTLASYAATVAATCVFAHDLTPGGGGYGQNIAEGGTTDPNEANKDPNLQVAGVITDMWYNGELPAFLPSYYGEANPDFSNFGAWGHFTQVVWAGTQSVGCATQYCKSGTAIYPKSYSGWFTVCNYSPEGNMGGEYGANVGKPLRHPTVSV